MANFVSKYSGAQHDEAVRLTGELNGKVATLSEEIAELKGEGEEGTVTSEEITIPALLNKAAGVNQTVIGDNIRIYNVGNMFNKNAWKPKQRYDDSGNVVSDASSGYIDQLVPVANGMVLYTSVAIQRVCYFDKDKNFIKRHGAPSAGRFDVKLDDVGLEDDIGFVTFQFKTSDIEPLLDTAHITLLKDWHEEVPTEYMPFTAGSVSTEKLYTGKNLVFSTTSNTATLNTITGTATSELYDGRVAPLFSTIDVWEPETVDEGYSNPTSGWGQDTDKADWTSADKFDYYGFLAHYYDPYVGIYDDGYKVTKRSLGQDSSKTGYELFEYDFCPVDYKYTVLLSAGMNADETQGIWGVATFMRCVMNDEEANLALAHKHIRFKVIPVINASGFDQTPMRYHYADGTNPNYNFNHKNSWSQHTSSVKGEYPDSDCVTQYIKKWLNDNSQRADLWLDLHTGRWKVDGGTNKKIMDVRVADISMDAVFTPYETLIRQFYTAKGYITDSDTIGGTMVIRDNLDYQKTVYAFDVCGIPSIMPEMHLESTGYGTDGYTNNAPNGIRAYVLQIRAMVMAYVNAAAGKARALDSDGAAKFHQRYL